MKPPRNIVGPIIRKLREEKGLTQAQFVAKLNISGWDLSRDTFAKIEAQIRWVADFEIQKLAIGIGMDAPELLRRALISHQGLTNDVRNEPVKKSKPKGK